MGGDGWGTMRTHPESQPGAADPDRVLVDVQRIEAVAAFYRRASLVVNAAAEDMRAHTFGSWSPGDTYRPMADRYAAMGAMLAQRLTSQAAAAAELSERLFRGVEGFDNADGECAMRIRRSVDVVAAEDVPPHGPVPGAR